MECKQFTNALLLHATHPWLKLNHRRETDLEREREREREREKRERREHTYTHGGAELQEWEENSNVLKKREIGNRMKILKHRERERRHTAITQKSSEEKVRAHTRILFTMFSCLCVSLSILLCRKRGTSEENEIRVLILRLISQWEKNNSKRVKRERGVSVFSL